MWRSIATNTHGTHVCVSWAGQSSALNRVARPTPTYIPVPAWWVGEDAGRQHVMADELACAELHR